MLKKDFLKVKTYQSNARTGSSITVDYMNLPIGIPIQWEDRHNSPWVGQSHVRLCSC